MKFLLIFLSLTLATLADEDTSPITVKDLECEYRTNPEGITRPSPRLSWHLTGSGRGLRQSAYQILVASTEEKLTAGTGDLWDSGETKAYRNRNVPYEGEALQADQTAHWKVRIKDQDDKWTAWSAPARFTFKPDADKPSPLPLFVKEAPRISSFESSDETLNALYSAAAGKLPEITDLEGIQLALRSACYHRDLLPRAIDWLTLLNASTDDRDLYPGSLPPKDKPGSLTSDAGILAAHALWLMAGDKEALSNNWKTMHKYLTARKLIDPDYSGRAFGELPAGTIPEGDPTPPELIHTATQGVLYRIMSELSRTAADTPFETPILEGAYKNLREEYRKRYLNKDNRLKIDSSLAQLITLRFGLLSTQEEKDAVSAQFLEGFKDSEAFTEGPLGDYSLLPVLTWTDNHDRALKIAKAQSPDDLSPVALAAISEWLIWMVGGIDSLAPGFQHVRFAPYIPSKDVLSHAKATYDSPHGRIVSHWHYEEDGLHYEVSLPPNTFATVILPVSEENALTESGKALDDVPEIVRKSRQGNQQVLMILPGDYDFKVSVK